MKVLVVGAGAVGQVYGWHLQRGGAEVTFLVKEKYRAAAEAGFTMYPLNTGTTGVPFEGFSVVTTPEQVAQRDFDQVWITLSSPALRGAWRKPTLAAAGDATIVSFSPGADDAALLREDVAADRLVIGLIPFIAYQAPLEGETRFDKPGLAIWHPPFSKTPLSGPVAAVDLAVATLRRGGCKATAHPRVQTASMFPTALMMPTLVALELSGWTFAGLRRSGMLALSSQANREACALVARRENVTVPFFTKLARPWTLSLFSRVAPWLVPLDLQTYLRYHFTKVGDQTRMFIKGYIDLAAQQGVEVPGLVALRDALHKKDAKRAPAVAPARQTAAAHA